MNEVATKTEEILAAMMVENTGAHMLDSGGAYGRNWSRNAAKADDDPVAYFNSRPEAFWSYGPTLDVFHFLRERVEYAPKLDRAWRTFVQVGPMPRALSSYYGDTDVRYFNWPQTAEQFADQLAAKGWADKGPDFAGMTVNTYNGEDFLTQVLQYTIVYLDESCPWADDGQGYYVLLSIHGGCDVRGGYTDLRAFALGDYDGVFYLLDNARAELVCHTEGCLSEYGTVHNWMADGSSSSWLYDGGTGGPDPEPAPDDEHGERLPRCPFCKNELDVYPPTVS